MAVADIILSPATVKYAPVGEALPDENVVGYGGAWGGNWVDVGYTSIPLSVNFAKEVYEVMVEQVTNPVKRMVTKETMEAETALAEMTGANMQLAFGGTLTVTPAGGAQVGMTELEAGGEVALTEYAFGFEGLYQDDTGAQFPVRFFIYRGSAILNGQLQFAKNKEASIPLRITASADLTKVAGKQLFKWQKVTEAAGS